MFRYILATALFILTSCNYAVATQWVTKPIQCGDAKEAGKLLKETNQVVLLGALGRAVTADMIEQDNIQPFPAAIYVFYDPEYSTFTIIEYINVDEVCVLSFGDGVVFDPEQLEIFLKEMFDDET